MSQNCHSKMCVFLFTMFIHPYIDIFLCFYLKYFFIFWWEGVLVFYLPFLFCLDGNWECICTFLFAICIFSPLVGIYLCLLFEMCIVPGFATFIVSGWECIFLFAIFFLFWRELRRHQILPLGHPRSQQHIFLSHFLFHSHIFCF